MAPERERGRCGLVGFHSPTLLLREEVAAEREKLVEQLVGGKATLEALRAALENLRLSAEEREQLLASLANLEAELLSKADYVPPTAPQLDVLLEALNRRAMQSGADKLKITPYRAKGAKAKIEGLFPQMAMRQQLNEVGGRKIARKWWQLMADPKPSKKGHLATADDALNMQLGGILKEVMAKMGLISEKEKAEGVTDAEKLAMVLGKGELRAGKIEEADALVQQELESRHADAIGRLEERAEEFEMDEEELEAKRQEIDARFELLTEQWEEATSSLQREPASMRLFRKMVHATPAKYDWPEHFNERRDTAIVRAQVVETLVNEVAAATHNPLDLDKVRTASGQAFDQVALVKENKWKLAKARVAKKGDEPNSTAQQIIDRFQTAQTEWLK